MAGPPNPRLQRRVELLIRVAAPVLDVVLLVVQAASRMLHRDPPEPLATAGGGTLTRTRTTRGMR